MLVARVGSVNSLDLDMGWGALSLPYTHCFESQVFSNGLPEETSFNTSKLTTKMAPSPITEDYYMVLEVSQTATPELITRSYRRLALRLHPDRSAQGGSTQAFQTVSPFD